MDKHDYNENYWKIAVKKDLKQELKSFRENYNRKSSINLSLGELASMALNEFIKKETKRLEKEHNND